MAPFVPRQRKHKKIQKTHQHQFTGNSLDSNIVEIHSSTTSEKIARKDAIKNELHNEQSVMSSGKRKRLDKYIVSYTIYTEARSTEKSITDEKDRTRN